MNWAHAGIILALILVAGLACPVAPAAASGQYIWVTPRSGPPGTKITVRGNTFTPSMIYEDADNSTITYAKTYFDRVPVAHLYCICRHPRGKGRVLPPICQVSSPKSNVWFLPQKESGGPGGPPH